jgi:hypothetical protein
MFQAIGLETSVIHNQAIFILGVLRVKFGSHYTEPDPSGRDVISLFCVGIRLSNMIFPCAYGFILLDSYMLHWH